MSTTILCDHRFISGKIPERPNGSDCKSDVFDFGSSNLPLPTTKKAIPFRVSLFWLARGNCRSAVFAVVRASGAGKNRSAFPFCFFRTATLPRFARVCTSSYPQTDDTLSVSPVWFLGGNTFLQQKKAGAKMRPPFFGPPSGEQDILIRIALPSRARSLSYKRNPPSFRDN